MSKCAESEDSDVSNTNYQIYFDYCQYYSPEIDVNYGTYQYINRSCIALDPESADMYKSL